jgi:ATP-dependent helicase/nuclease subunit B
VNISAADCAILHAANYAHWAAAVAYLLHNAAAHQQWGQAPAQLEQLRTELTVEALLQRAAQADAPERWLLVVPTERRVRWLKRRFVRELARLHGVAAPEPPIFTLAGFVWSCLGRLFPPGEFVQLSEAYHVALIEEALRRAPVRLYRRVGQEFIPAPLLQRLAEVVAGLRKDGITAEELAQRLLLAEESADPSVDRLRLSDLLALMEAYEELLGEHILDEAAAFRLLVRQCACEGVGLFRRLFPSAELLLLEGFSEFRQPELELLAQLARQDLPVWVRLDYSVENGPLFGNFQQHIELLRDAGYRTLALDPPLLMTEQTPPSERIFLPLGAYLRRWLFNTEREIRHPGFSGRIAIVECSDRVGEVITIARLVKYLLQCEGYRPGEIAIVMRQPALYTALFREIFARFGIPANITDRLWLAQAPVVVTILSVLELPLNGFRREELQRVLQSPYVQSLEGEGEPIERANLLTVAEQRRILGGHRFGGAQGWRRRLEYACRMLEQQYRLLQEDPYADPLELQAAQQSLEACQRALRDFERLHQRFGWSARLYTPQEFLRLVTEEIIVGMGIYDALLEAYRAVRAQQWRSTAEWLHLLEQLERDARALSAFVELLEEFVVLFQRLWGEQPRPLAQYVERLRTAVLGTRYQLREKPGAGVTVTAIEQARGIPFRVLILCGALDGEFPLVYQPEHFLGYVPAEAQERHVRAERMLFYQFLTNHPEALENGQQRLFITYPRQQDGEELVRSPFVDELLKVTSLEQDGWVISAEELSRRLARGEAAEELRRVPWLWVRATPAEIAEVLLARSDPLPAPLRERLPAGVAQPWNPSKPTFLELLPHEQQRLLERVGTLFSASELELYQQCPYRYFAANILRLRPLEPPTLELSPLERGILLHRIAYRFFRTLQAEEAPVLVQPRRPGSPALQPVQLRAERMAYYRELLHRIAREELEHVRFEHPWFELEREELLGTPERSGILEAWLEWELERAARGFLPVAFELGFGLRPTAVPPVELRPDVLLQGRIDRLELLWGEPPLLGIADYKSGRMANLPGAKQLRRGEHLQLPLYLWAAQQLLQRDYALESEPARAAFYALRPHRGSKGRLEASERALITSETASEAIERAIATALQVVESIRHGRFPVQPSSCTVCRSCPYKALCRIAEVRQPVPLDEAE